MGSGEAFSAIKLLMGYFKQILHIYKHCDFVVGVAIEDDFSIPAINTTNQLLKNFLKN